MFKIQSFNFFHLIVFSKTIYTLMALEFEVKLCINTKQFRVHGRIKVHEYCFTRVFNITVINLIKIHNYIFEFNLTSKILFCTSNIQKSIQMMTFVLC